MTKTSEAATRIFNLRTNSLGETQAQFGERFDVTQASVSLWEKGQSDEDVPGVGARLALGNLAAEFLSIEDALWFWEWAGLNEKRMLVAAGQILKAAPSEMVAGLLRELPEGTSWFRVPKENPGVFTPGDMIVLDESHKDVPSLQNQIVLARLTPPKDREKMKRAQEQWPRSGGLVMGRLLLKSYDRRDWLLWYLTLGPFNDTEMSWRASPEGTLNIGSYQHPSVPDEPTPGSEREKLHKKRAEAYGRLKDEVARSRGDEDEGTEKARKDLDELDGQIIAAKAAEQKEAERKAEAEAPEKVKLYDGAEILGRVFAWFNLGGEKT